MVEAVIYVPIVLLAVFLLILLGLFFLQVHMNTVSMLRDTGNGLVKAYGYRSDGGGVEYMTNDEVYSLYIDGEFNPASERWGKGENTLIREDAATIRGVETNGIFNWYSRRREATIRNPISFIYGPRTIRLNTGSATTIRVNPMNMSRVRDLVRLYYNNTDSLSYWQVTLAVAMTGGGRVQLR